MQTAPIAYLSPTIPKPDRNVIKLVIGQTHAAITHVGDNLSGAMIDIAGCGSYRITAVLKSAIEVERIVCLETKNVIAPRRNNGHPRSPFPQRRKGKR